MAVLNFAGRRKVLGVFGPDDPSEVLEQIQSLASEPSDSLLERVADVISKYPLSHNLRLMCCAVLREKKFTSQALDLLRDSLVIYPESPILLEKYLATAVDLPEPVAVLLSERAMSVRRSTSPLVKGKKRDR